MKRTILFFGLIFLTGCAGHDFKQEVCSPRFWQTRYVLNFEYGSDTMNKSAEKEVIDIARKVNYSDGAVCIVGYETYRGVPSYAATIAYRRALNTAKTFLKVGVKPEKIYIDMEPQSEPAGLSAPQTAAQERRQAEIRVRK